MKFCFFLILLPLTVFAESNSTPDASTFSPPDNRFEQEVNENVREADPNMQQINKDLVPPSAMPGESVEGRTEDTTPAQNKEIYKEYEKFQNES